MLGSLLKTLSVPHVPVRVVASAGVVSSFVWLLSQTSSTPWSFTSWSSTWPS